MFLLGVLAGVGLCAAIWAVAWALVRARGEGEVPE